jgi:type III secretion system YscD/HrpQ family protein
LNGEEIFEKTKLQEGDEILLGQTHFRFFADSTSKKKKHTQGAYDDIFGSLSEHPLQEPLIEKDAETSASLPSEPSAYDTIFEEAKEEEEQPLPFAFLPDTPYVLKVISGPNTGAEIGLERGRGYTIGKESETSDIAFQDLSVSRHHAKLEVGEDGQITIEDLGSKNGTAVNGVLVTEKRGVTSQDLISVGTTVFLIIDREAPQETIYSAIPPSTELLTKHEESSSLPIEIPVIPTDWKKEPIPPKYLIAAGSVFLLFLITFLSFFSLFKSDHLEIAKQHPEEQIQKAIEKFQAVKFSFNPASGKLFLVGHVLTATDFQEMRYHLQQISAITSLDENVVIDEYVNKMMNDVLMENGNFKSVSIQSANPGKFMAVGTVQNNQQAMALGDYLTLNFPYLDRLENKVITVENLTAETSALLVGQGFGSVQLQMNGSEIILSGLYSNAMEKQYQQLLKTLNHLPGVSSVKSIAVATTPNQAAIDISDQFQVTGVSSFEGHGYTIVLNGKIYTLGDAVNGMKIQSIESNMILLEKDGIKYKINYMR